MQNIIKLSHDHYEVRISYTDALTSKRKSVRRRVQGSLSQAREVRTALQHQVNTDTVETAKLAGRTVSEWSDEYLSRAEKRLAASSITSERHHVKEILKDVGDWQPSEITVRSLDRLTERWATYTRSDTEALYSAATIRHRVQVLRRLLRFIKRRTEDDLSVLLHLEAPEMGKRPVRRGSALTASQASKFLSKFRTLYPQYYALVYYMLTTGQRFGSVSALRWIDISEDSITFAQSQYRGAVKDGNKSGKVVRLPLTTALNDVLQWHKRHLIDSNNPNMDMGLVFPALTLAAEAACKGYLYASQLKRPFELTCKAAEVPRITPHDLRRTYNTIQIEAGIDGTILRSITGHSSAALTDRYYYGSASAKAAAIDTITTLMPSTCG